VINLLTSPRRLWVLWPALGIGALLAWSALKAYYPDLVGADHHGRQKIGGDVTFSEDTRFRGRIGGNVVVAPGVRLELIGRVGGDLTIERDAIAEVRGKIGGHVRNRGGTLQLDGKLSGELREEEGADPPPDVRDGRSHPHQP
jgi:hypothetical protein